MNDNNTINITDATAADEAAHAFVQRWSASASAERANFGLFFSELCDLLGLPHPEPSVGGGGGYVFERAIRFPDGTTGFADLYKAGCAVIEGKQMDHATGDDESGEVADPLSGRKRRRGSSVRRGTPGYEAKMRAAKEQAARYARAVEPDAPAVPFVVAVDVGFCLDLHAAFSGDGRAYAPFPDARRFRIRLEDLTREDVRETLRLVLTDPHALDPARRQAQATRDLARKLARLATSLEAAGHEPGAVFGFLTRALFTAFAEDVGLVPNGAFTRMLEGYRHDLGLLPDALEGVWRTMDVGGYAADLRARVPRFNGGLFRDPRALPLTEPQLDALLEAVRADWRAVEPAILGTLLERALDPEERHALGAHFTPRAFVERLVRPAVLDPLQEEWDAALTAATALDAAGKPKEARREVERFLRRLTSVRVLDPACGSGNFLYVTLAGLKAMEAEVVRVLTTFGGQAGLELAGVAVTPAQLLGIEVNPRAAAIADLVLWIGHIQWFLRSHDEAQRPPEPILSDYGNIECRDAIVADDADGRPVPAPWPAAEFVVGNPPFLGKGERMRAALGQDYLDALAAAYPDVPASADFVMYWFERAARAVRGGRAERFGLITTSSITQTFNRRVVESHIKADDDPLALVFAVPNHAWVDDGADVRVAMTVGARVADVDPDAGRLVRVVVEGEQGEDGVAEVELIETRGRINADLTVGADVTEAEPLEANAGLSNTGVMLAGRGFLVTPEEAAGLGLGRVKGLDRHIRPTLTGRDLAQPARTRYVIDLYGLTADEAREMYAEAYDHVLRTVKPERDENRRTSRRENWWIFGEPNPALRKALAGLPRYIATPETAKHRIFVFLDDAVLPEHKLIAIALDDAYHLGVLSSRVHTTWALAAGGRLGVGNDPVYNKTRCFEPFPFPFATEAQAAEIRRLGEALDRHRKQRQEAHPDLGLTEIYNAVEGLREGRALTAKEEKARRAGLADTLLQLHRDLDRAVLAAYGWDDVDADAARFEAAVVSRLVALNAERRAEEEAKLVRYLRPAFQDTAGAGQQAALTLAGDEALGAALPHAKAKWPSGLAERVAAVQRALRASQRPLGPKEVAGRFSKARPADVAAVLDALVVVGAIRATGDGRYAT